MDEQQTQQPQQPTTPEPMADQKDVQDNRGITYLSYIGLLFLVPMLAKKESKFAQYHAKQGLVLTIGWFAGGFLYFLLGLGVLVHLAIIIFSIMGLINVSKGIMKPLPIIGNLAAKINI